MGKILKPAGGKRSAVMSYTKHYYIGSERISAKTGTCVNTGYYPQGYLATKMPDLDENLVRTPSDDKVGRAGESIYNVHEKFGLNPPALSSTQDYVEDSSSFNHMRNELDYFYFHPDHLGSSSYITNAAGTVSQHMEYLPFGELLVDEHTNSYNSPFKYNGKEFDEETGNYYYSARYYDPKWSIFISVDPLAEKYPSWNPYAYTFQNPINFIDPDGMAPDDWYKNLFTGKVTWKEGTGSRLGYEHLGYSWGSTDVDGNRLQMDGNTQQITYNGEVRYDYNNQKLRGGFAFSDGGQNQNPSSLDKGGRDVQWIDAGGAITALTAIASVQLKPFSYFRGKGSNGGKPTFSDKVDNAVDATSFGADATKETITLYDYSVSPPLGPRGMNKAAQLHTSNKRDTVVETKDKSSVLERQARFKQEKLQEADEMNNANRR